MNFGGAIEALKAGMAVIRNGRVYRYSVLRNCVFVGKDGVSTSVGTFNIDDVMAEDWRITGYEHKGVENEQAESVLDLREPERSGFPRTGEPACSGGADVE
jgi:hypothetical protein